MDILFTASINTAVRLMIGLALYFLIRPAKGSPRSPVNTGRLWLAWACPIALLAIHAPHPGSTANALAFYAVSFIGVGVIAFTIGAVIGKVKSGETTSSNQLQTDTEPVTTSLPEKMLEPIAPKAVKMEPLNQTDEDRIYVQIAGELEGGNHDKATWTKAYSLCDGDDQKTRSTYIKLRFNRLSALQPEIAVPETPLDTTIAIASAEKVEPQPEEEPPKVAATGQNQTVSDPMEDKIIGGTILVGIMVLLLVGIFAASSPSTSPNADANGKVDSKPSAVPSTVNTEYESALRQCDAQASAAPDSNLMQKDEVRRECMYRKGGNVISH